MIDTVSVCAVCGRAILCVCALSLGAVYLCHLSGLSPHVQCVCVTCMLGGGHVLSAGTPESPEEMAVSQVMETMGGEVPPQQTEQADSSRGGVQPHLEEERCVGWGKARVHISLFSIQ